MSTKDGTEKVKPEPTYTVRTHGNMTTLKVSEEKVKRKCPKCGTIVKELIPNPTTGITQICLYCGWGDDMEEPK